mmetsp:Transcript_148229/g.259083  ORF Transcript_148229/g.259083 Transcript_148229/m.259083 type:complete len:96 (-) Transcript_148229:174-461(-)
MKDYCPSIVHRIVEFLTLRPAPTLLCLPGYPNGTVRANVATTATYSLLVKLMDQVITKTRTRTPYKKWDTPLREMISNVADSQENDRKQYLSCAQ